MINWTLFRKHIRFLSFLLIGSLLSGCLGVKMPGSSELTYYNGYLGLEIVVPGRWDVYDINDTNMTGSAEESDDYSGLEFEQYENGEWYMDLITIQNKTNDSADDHAMLRVYAEDSVDIYPYIEDYADAFSYDISGYWGDDYYTELLSRTNVVMNGVDYICLQFQVTHPENDVPYIEEYYLCRVQGMYLVSYINYWSDSSSSEEEIRSILENNIRLSKGSEEDSFDDDYFGGGSDYYTVGEGTYYNGYLGLTLLVDDDEYEVSINETNMTETPQQSNTLDQLDISEYADQGYFISLATVYADIEGEIDKFASLDLYAEGDTPFNNLDDFVDNYIENFVYDDSDFTSSLDSREYVEINGQPYTCLTITVQSQSSGNSFVEEHYISQVKDLFFIAYLQYSSDSRNAYSKSQYMVRNSFGFGDIAGNESDGGLNGGLVQI